MLTVSEPDGTGAPPSPARILIIGREGQVASAIRTRLAEHGFVVATLARPAFDLLQPAAIAEAIIAFRPRVVINPAAYTAVDKAEDEPELAFAINSIAAGAIAKAAADVNASVIHFSTDYVFDGASERAYCESDPVGPISVYGASKLAGERAVMLANPAHLILRTAWVCSPVGTNFVKTMLRLGAERTLLRVVDDQYGSPTFADDLASAVEGLVRSLTTAPTAANRYGLYNLTNAGDTTWCGFAGAIMAGATARGRQMATVVPISTAEYPTRAARPKFSRLSPTKITAAFGIHMPAWEDGLDRCLDALIGPRLQPKTRSNT